MTTSITKSRGITAHVTEDFQRKFERKAREVPGRTACELARTVLEDYIARTPVEQRLMEELWTLRYVLINAFPEITRDLVTEADQKKTDKARAILAEARG